MYRLDELGYGVGIRLSEVLFLREKYGKRENRLLPMLQFIVSVGWKSMFGKGADTLERSTENMDECKKCNIQ